MIFIITFWEFWNFDLYFPLSNKSCLKSFKFHGGRASPGGIESDMHTRSHSHTHTVTPSWKLQHLSFLLPWPWSSEKCVKSPPCLSVYLFRLLKSLFRTPPRPTANCNLCDYTVGAPHISFLILLFSSLSDSLSLRRVSCAEHKVGFDFGHQPEFF